MNNKLSIVTSQTMSSREISNLTGKMHPHVKRDIERMCSEINHPNLDSSEYTHRGNVYNEYLLDRDMTLCLVSGYSAPLRMKIIQRWRELEEVQKPKIPQTLSEALQLAADQAKQLELQAPKVAFVEKLVERNGLMNATQIAQKHGLSAIRLNKILVDLGVYSRTTKRGRVFMQWFINKGYGEIKQTEQGFSQALFTNAGEVWINEKLINEGIV